SRVRWARGSRELWLARRRPLPEPRREARRPLLALRPRSRLPPAPLRKPRLVLPRREPPRHRPSRPRAVARNEDEGPPGPVDARPAEEAQGFAPGAVQPALPDGDRPA